MISDIFQIPMADFVGSAARPEIQKAVDFIADVSGGGKTVYVHCKVRHFLLANRRPDEHVARRWRCAG